MVHNSTRRYIKNGYFYTKNIKVQYVKRHIHTQLRKKEQGVKEHFKRLNISALLCSIMRQMMQRKSLFSLHCVS